MSASSDPPLELKYRPIFDSLPSVSDETYYDESRGLVHEAFQSFPFLPGYQNISFEEQRVNGTLPMATGKIGRFTPSALRLLKAAYRSHKITENDDSGLLEPLLPIVIVRVGKGEITTPFAIHRNILEHCSPFFSSMRSPKQDTDTIHGLKQRESSVESGTELEREQTHDTKTESVIECKFDVDVAAFRLYAEWVYSSRIQKRAPGVNAEDVDFSSMGQAYILGEKLLDKNFKNAIVDLLLQTIVTHGKMDLTLPTLIFNESFSTAPLRKLLVDLYVWFGHKDWLKPDGSKEAMSATFSSDLNAAFFDCHGHDGSPKARMPATIMSIQPERSVRLVCAIPGRSLNQIQDHEEA